jgi:hypothetical protein
MKFVVYNRHLNPNLWQGGKLIPQIRLNLLKIAYDFYGESNLAAPILDIVIIGSATNYNWTPTSDIDLHIIIDFKAINDNHEIAKKIADSFKDNWNTSHNVFIHTHKVELYLQSTVEINQSESSYSLLKNDWIVSPVYNPPTLNKDEIRQKYASLVALIGDTIETKNISNLRHLMDQIKSVRSNGLKMDGEFGTDNIVFKLLRNRGHIKKLKDALVRLYDQSVSLSEAIKPKNDAEKYALDLIQKIFNRHRSLRKDPFNSHEILLMIDNERDLQNLMEKYAQLVYPTSDEPSYQFKNDIENMIGRMEDDHYARRRNKVGTPIDVLKHLVRGKTWKQAKRDLIKQSLGFPQHERVPMDIPDDEADTVFSRHYKLAHGETMYTEPKDSPRLNALIRNSDHRSAYEHNMMLDYYVGHNAVKFPDTIRVYRGVNSNVADIRPGDYVTLDRDYARSYVRGKFGMIKTAILNTADLYLMRADPGGTGLLYWPPGHQIKDVEQVPSFRDFWLANAQP